MATPKWSTPERRAYLVELFHRSKGLCLHGEVGCRNPRHYYADIQEDLIAEWIQYDREQAAGRWLAEAERVHADDPATTPPYGRRFDPVARHEYLAQQPAYFPEGLGPNPLTQRLTAIVRVPSTDVRLHVNVDAARQGQGKNARRKAQRYGKGLSPEGKADVDRLCYEAVNDYRW